VIGAGFALFKRQSFLTEPAGPETFDEEWIDAGIGIHRE
jgi:hypothetical protein